MQIAKRMSAVTPVRQPRAGCCPPREKVTWADREIAGCCFKDARLGRRFGKLLSRIGSAIGQSIPLVCQDWANTKAAYRFFSNERVSETDILAGHFHSTRDRFAATGGPVLILHDTTEFTYEREQPALIGATKSVNSGRDKAGRVRSHTVCGILMHSSLAVTTQGLPPAPAAAKFWTRKKFKGSNALKKKINPTRVPIEKKESVRWLENLTQSTKLLGEPSRCVHIGDRESDIYELFCAAHAAGTHFLTRTCVDRLAGDGGHTISDEMDEVAVKGPHRVEVGDGKGGTSQAVLEIRYRRIHVLPHIGKQRRYPALDLTVIHAQERGPPKSRKPIDWKLTTDLPVDSRKNAIEKLNWYAMRWKIEVFHKILKSGCKAEHSKLRTAQRLANLIAVFCILSWRVFWMTMMNRATQNAPPKLALTDLEITLLDTLVRDTRKTPAGTKALSHYLVKIARLGGYLARASDPPPGNMVMWKGLSRLMDIELGVTLGAKFVGN
jgi:Transposase DNA-binding